MTFDVRRSDIADSTVCEVKYLESIGEHLYAKFERDDAEVSMISRRLARSNTKFQTVVDARSLKVLEWIWLLASRYIWKGLPPPRYLISSADENVYKLNGLRRSRLESVSLKQAFTSSLGAYAERNFALGQLFFGAQEFDQMLRLSLVRASTREGRGLVRDGAGNVFYLDKDRNLRLYDEAQRKVYNFGRLPVVGCSRPRMSLDDERGLLFIWCSIGFLKVFSAKPSSTLEN